MKKINIIIDIDDLCPSTDYGILKDKSEYKYIDRLQDEFPGLKFTLYVPANFEGRADLRMNKDWVEWLKSKKNIEVCCHGLTHKNLYNEKDYREFAGVTPYEVLFRINEAKKIFNECGITVEGFKAGGWDVIPETYNIVAGSFLYMADHIMGTKIRKLDNGLTIVPYTYSIDDIGPKIFDTIILHGHISQKNGNKNGLNGLIFNNLRNYLHLLNERYDVNYMTMGELVKNGNA